MPSAIVKIQSTWSLSIIQTESELESAQRKKIISKGIKNVGTEVKL